MSDKITSILLTGPPGVGKTTIIQKLVKLMETHKLNFCGFYTEEVRSESGSRIGFDIVSLDGKRAILARQNPTDTIKRPQIGKYSVYVQDFEDIALPALKVCPKTLLIVDEIGKMELLSKQFTQQISKVFGRTAILATVPNRQTIDIVERMKADQNSLVLEITKKNRNEIIDHIFENAIQIITK